MAADKKILVAHRGASAYAPEHTLAAYRLAIEQGADFVEQDLAVTKDGTLVSIHDPSLERTTNVEEVFPDRFVEEKAGPKPGKRWFVRDFTLAEIKRLDAGSWFDPKFAGARVPTWEEAIETVRGKAGFCPELKEPHRYRERGVEMADLFVESLKRHSLDKDTPLIVQSFDAESLRRVARAMPALPRIFLLEPDAAEKWLSSDGLKELKTFATGIGPSKHILEKDPDAVRRAHAAGLTVVPYTFRQSRAGGPLPRFATVRDEMSHFLFTLGVDGLFTDNPDQFPRTKDLQKER
jgi:glycerophosphoryl diester phosphodiesterase